MFRSFDSLELLQLAHGTFQFARAEKSKPNRPRHPKSAVVGRAAAKSNNDFTHVVPRSVEHHLANAKRAGEINITFVGPQSAHPGRFAHLHHRETVLVDVGVTRFDIAAEWIVRFAFQPRTAQRIANY